MSLRNLPTAGVTCGSIETEFRKPMWSDISKCLIASRKKTRDWCYVIHQSVFEQQFVQLPAHERRLLREAFQRMTAHPLIEPDSEIRRGNDRLNYVRKHVTFEIVYWIDFLVREIVSFG